MWTGQSPQRLMWPANIPSGPTVTASRQKNAQRTAKAPMTMVGSQLMRRRVGARDRRRPAEEQDGDQGTAQADPDDADGPEPDQRRDGHQGEGPDDHPERRAVGEPLERAEMLGEADEEGDAQGAHRCEQRERGEDAQHPAVSSATLGG